jgi:hypothetical protein
MVHDEPFHVSRKGVDLHAVDPLEVVPTATQDVVLTHETELRTESVKSGGLVVVTIDHVLPFHFSANVCISAAGWLGSVSQSPTAMQKSALTQETSSSWLSFAGEA